LSRIICEYIIRPVDKPKRPRGQPPKKDPASVRINVRVTPGERERYKAAARKAGTKLSPWLKALADRESS
jgi:predicted HicB family RNase H-like nuclease